MAALVDLAVRLDRDRSAPEPERRQRDRKIGQQLAPLAARPVAQTLAWLDALRRESEERESAAARWVHGASVALVLVGLLVGAAVAGGVFYYDGTRPVNVIHVLAVFVFLQLVTVLLTLLAALPARVTHWLPGMHALQQTLWLLSPGRLAGLMTRWLPQPDREQAQQLIGHARAHGALYRGVRQWAILTWAQSFAVAFNVAALATAMALVTFSDLAFGWSTTLRVDTETLAGIVQPLAWPWAWAWPAARPSVELIEASRYFRPVQIDPEVAPLLGQWWPFLVMCMAVYGLLPRVVLLGVALHQRRRAVVAAIRYHPAVRRLLERMNEPIVTTHDAGEAAQAESMVTSGHVATDWPRAEGPVCVIDWAQVPVEGATVDQLLQQRCGAMPEAKLEAGGARSVDEDARVIERAVGVVGEYGLIVMLVRAWEPPMAEVTDFLAQLRDALPHGRPIVVAPIGAEGLAPASANLEQWQRRLGTLGDPWLHVATLTTGDDAEVQT